MPSDQVSPHALSDWLARDLGPAVRVRERIDMNGTSRLTDLLEQLLQAPVSAGWCQAEEGLQHVHV